MLATSAVASLPKLPPVRRGGHCSEENVATTPKPTRGLQMVNNSVSLSCTRLPFGPRTHSTQRAAIICAAALNARCGAEQTQTVIRQSPTITHLPGKEQEKSPDLDDGDSGFPPRDDDDGGGGGGGGGGNWSGGFFFFGFLAFLGFLKDKESEDPYGDNRRRR
ncbi:protein YELLOW LEAF 1, choloroplastic-like [Lotus japonicus]|uniref:protein YELLOW LEAF 1, choloroplastic-like n=1 Tax=Lotus japonicus TaxID=34305 RepID=UPI002582CDCC|nr:protein YELLOW LEAF 1, choloroplastic-like [Lotus japonicus]